MRILFVVYAFLISVLLLLPSAAAQDAPDYGAALQQEMEYAGVRGASVAVIRNGAIAWTGAYGVTDQRTGRPVTTSTEFEAASLGKMIGTYAALILNERGQLPLDLPLEDTRLRVPPDCPTPPLRAALSHSAGLANNLYAEEFPVKCASVGTFAYSGQGFLVLQSMIGEAAGMPAEEFIRHEIFTPLHMDQSRYEPVTTDEMATGYVDLIFGLLSGRTTQTLRLAGFGILALGLLVALYLCATVLRLLGWGRGLLASLLIVFGVLLANAFALSRISGPITARNDRVLLASSLDSTAPDLARFALELLHPTLVSEETRDRMFSPQVEVNDTIAWGLGIGIDRTDGHTTYWHWGSNPGFQSLFVIEPATGNGVVILTNTGGFADFASRRYGGYNASKRLARQIMGFDGAWDLRG